MRLTMGFDGEILHGFGSEDTPEGCYSRDNDNWQGPVGSTSREVMSLG